jgi:hypothetical protein
LGPRTGLDDVERNKTLPLPGLELRPHGHPARSRSLYRVHYPGSLTKTAKKHNLIQAVILLYVSSPFLIFDSVCLLHCRAISLNMNFLQLQDGSHLNNFVKLRALPVLWFSCNCVYPPADGGMRYRSWLRHYATSRKVAGSIPDEVIEFFN